MTTTSNGGPAPGPASAHALHRRRLGRVGIDVTELSLGGVGLGGAYGEVSDQDAIRAVHRALALGINLIDTSPLYRESERRIGLALAALGGRPPGLHLSTKTGTHPARRGDYSAEGTRWSVENSLRLLVVQHVDLLLVHDPESMDPVLAPGGALDELDRLRKEGRLGAIGLGVREHEFHRRAIATGRFDAILTYADYNLMRQTAAPLIEEAAAAGLGVLLGQALLAGLLAGGDPLADERLAGRPGAEAARGWWLWAREREVPLQAVALQFALRNAHVGAVLVGARTAQEVEENVRAATLPLPQEIWAEVEERVRRGT